MTDLITLRKSDPRFREYLMGTFAGDQRALPVSSLNVRSDSEAVTFRIVPLANVPRPAWPWVGVKILRPRAFIQVLVPLFLILANLPAGGSTPSRIIFTTFSVLLLHAAILLRNDVDDHISGVDRLRPDRGSRAIQNGWVTAARLKQTSFGLLATGFFFCLPLLWMEPVLTVFLALTFCLGGFAFFWRERSYRELFGGSLLVCFMGGPLLSTGAEIALSGQADARGLMIGLVWGTLLLFPLQLRNFEHLLVQKRTGRMTWVGRLGFDRSTRWLQFLWFAGYSGFVAYHFSYGAALAAWFLIGLIGAISLPTTWRLRGLNSPAGSAVAVARRRGEFLFYLVVLVWVLEVSWRFPW